MSPPRPPLSPNQGRIHNHQRMGPGVHLHRQQVRDPEVQRQLEREREAERAADEARRQRELEEEAEIRELRRRAVPKANEVPEWYAFAPKKAKADSGK